MRLWVLVLSSGVVSATAVSWSLHPWWDRLHEQEWPCCRWCLHVWSVANALSFQHYCVISVHNMLQAASSSSPFLCSGRSGREIQPNSSRSGCGAGVRQEAGPDCELKLKVHAGPVFYRWHNESKYLRCRTDWSRLQSGVFIALLFKGIPFSCHTTTSCVLSAFTWEVCRQHVLCWSGEKLSWSHMCWGELNG